MVAKKTKLLWWPNSYRLKDSFDLFSIKQKKLNQLIRLFIWREALKRPNWPSKLLLKLIKKKDSI